MCSICNQDPCFFIKLNKRCELCGAKLKDDEDTYPLLTKEGAKDICNKCFNGEEE